jgi:hypothetical protein
MCTTLVLVALFVAAVLMSPALARLVGMVVLILIAFVVAARAEDRRPVPVPQLGAGCPQGYSSSPTSGTCVPSTGTRCRAFPSTGSCPTGWSFSPTSRSCIETVCR